MKKEVNHVDENDQKSLVVVVVVVVVDKPNSRPAPKVEISCE